MSDNASVTITRQSGYQFLVDFGQGLPTLLADEPAPLGEGTGPAPDHMLLAAVANCLSASLLFALQKFKQDPGVKLSLGQPAAALEHLDRVLDQFEAFCTVSMSVREGIAIHVQVQDGAGVVIKG
jgi:uncharacterized OsmC-like protein